MLLGAVILIGGVIFLLRNFLNSAPECTNPILHLTHTEIGVGDSLNFEDQTPDSKIRTWNFGDNYGTSDKQRGTYFYQEPGNYWVKLRVNDKCVDSLLVSVSRGINDTSAVSKSSIIAPSVAYVGQKITIKADASGASVWRWKFGENGIGYDSEGKSSVEYFYKYPGNYTITLLTDLSIYPATSEIKIEAKPLVNANQGQIASPKVQLPLAEDFAARLQARADQGKWKSQEEKNWFMGYFSRGMSTPVSWNIDDFPVKNFDFLINEFNTNPNGFEISKVSYTIDPKSGLISSLTINAKRTK